MIANASVRVFCMDRSVQWLVRSDTGGCAHRTMRSPILGAPCPATIEVQRPPQKNSMGGTPRSRSRTCERQDKCPTLI